MLRIFLFFPAIVCVISNAALAQHAADGTLTFERHIRPILKAHCFHCHGEGDEKKGNLDLRLRRLIVQGGDSGPALVPGQTQESPLIERIAAGEMPPGEKKLSPAEQDLISRWIQSGANTAGPEPEDPAALQFTADERAYWAFQPVKRPLLPLVQHPDRTRTPIDFFLLAKLEPVGLTFSPDAERHHLIRRAAFDLTGLPPHPDDVADFVADTAPDAYERLIDRLLESPQYGERWGRHWLDVAGYADSDGYTIDDTVRVHAYKYRDYVIRAFNTDKPFDQFIVEQLAGDELVPLPHSNLAPESIEKLVATGFLRTAPDGTGSGGVDQNLARNQVVAETIKVVSTSLLGLSVGCAQCHNHRYDPILQADYYRLRAVFEPAYNWKNWRPPGARMISLLTDADRQQSAAIEAEAVLIDEARKKQEQVFIERTFEKEVEKLPAEIRDAVRAAHQTPVDKRTPEQAKLLQDHPAANVTSGSLYLYDAAAAAELKKEAERAAATRAKKPVEDFVRLLNEVPGQIPVTYLFSRGDHDQPKQALPPGDLSILEHLSTTNLPDKDPALPTTGRRLAFARHLTSGQHPLVARVLVNRIWLHHFGRGLVATPGEFGALGERPSHPELLDWLASDFVSGGWRVKRLHKLLMLSAAYRQSSHREPAREKVDPENRLYGRMTIRRLEAEALRDSILSLSGNLKLRMFGAPVPIMEDEVGQFVVGIENLNGENRPGPILPMFGEDFRRSTYVQVRRSRPLAVLDTFDLPVMDPNCELRNASTVTPQALMLMNSDFVVAQAQAFAERLVRESGTDPASRVSRAWRLAFSTDPAPEQAARAVQFLTEQAVQFQQNDAAVPAGTPAPGTKPSPEMRALAGFCQALLSANELLYVD